MRQLTLEIEPRPALGREDFLVSKGNRAAVEWIDRWPEWPAPSLALAGPAGSGKSHLAQVWRAHSRAVALQGAELLQTLPSLPDNTQHCLIDEADRLAGDSVGEENLFHIYNRLNQQGGHLLLVGRSLPMRWPLEMPDLRSRLATAVPVELAMPDDALMQALLVKLFSDRQLLPGKGVIEFLIMRMERSYAAASRIVSEMDTRALEERREVRLPLARAVLHDLDRQERSVAEPHLEFERTEETEG
ncbi:MAG: HdaA/DnaA family protein [Pseudomonadota bacterium]